MLNFNQLLSLSCFCAMWMYYLQLTYLYTWSFVDRVVGGACTTAKMMTCE